MAQAKGGDESGNGGFLEISGRQYVELEGRIDLTAANGATGSFLIDPRNIDVLDVSPPGGVHPSWGWGYWTWDGVAGEWVFVADDTSTLRMLQLEYYLDLSNVTITTEGPDNDEGNVTFHHRPLRSGLDPGNPTGNSLTVVADNDIVFLPGSGIDFTGSGSLTLNAGRNVDIDAAINLAGGNFTSTGIDFDNTGGPIDTSGGRANIDHAGVVTLGADIATTGGSGGIEIDGSSVTVGGNINSGGDLTFFAPVIAAGTVSASGSANQLFDAGTGTLWAKDTITKTSVGNLTLSGDTLVNEIGWPADKSIAFVMGKYGPAVTRQEDVGIVAFIQMYLEGSSG